MRCAARDMYLVVGVTGAPRVGEASMLHNRFGQLFRKAANETQAQVRAAAAAVLQCYTTVASSALWCTRLGDLPHVHVAAAAAAADVIVRVFVLDAAGQTRWL